MIMWFENVFIRLCIHLYIYKNSFAIYFVFSFVVAAEVKPCKFSQTERSDQRRQYVVLRIWIHERKFISANEKKV